MRVLRHLGTPAAVRRGAVKILLANYRYFVSSGPERYLFNVKAQLESAGHQVAPFSVRYSRNEPTEYDRYFVSPLGGADEIYFDDHKASPAALGKTLSRLFYSGEVERSAAALAEDFRPDIAYVLYYLRKLSPSLLVGLKKRSVPIVVRLSDYGMFCPEHQCLRDGAPCTLCIGGDLRHSVRHRCVKGSAAISALEAAATLFHRSRGYFDLIDQFVTTNKFMTEMMVEAGFPRSRLTCIPTFADIDKFRPRDAAGDAPPYIAFVGRLDPAKGVHILVEAMGLLLRTHPDPPRLKIAGVEHVPGFVDQLKARVAAEGLGDLVEFLGPLPADQVASTIAGAQGLMMPALCFENLPNTVLEGFACGTPVISSDIGSLSRTVIPGVNGLLSEPGSAASLAEMIARLMDDPTGRRRLAEGARRSAETTYSPASHMAALETLFSQTVTRRSPSRS